MSETTRDRIYIFSASLITIATQLAFTRLLSFLYWDHLVYATISFALLGYGLSTVFFIICNHIYTDLSHDKMRNYAALSFSAIVPITIWIISITNIDLNSIRAGDFSKILLLPRVYMATILPFFFLGIIVICTLDKSSKDFATLYAFDLCGAAIGVGFFLLLFPKLGAVNFLFMASSSIGLLASIARRGRPAYSLLVIVPLTFLIGTNVILNPSPSKTIGKINQQAPSAAHLFSEWDPVAKVDIYDFSAFKDKPNDILWAPLHGNSLLLTNDADAYSLILREDVIDFRKVFASDLEFTLQKTIPKSLIIGIGGGMDIQYALGHGSRNVEAVEINGATIRAMKGQFSQASDSIYNSDRVRVFHQDGRSFVSNSNDQYDVIYMFGVDTFAAASQGAYANVENFLYTTDALKDYFRKTTEKGIISIHRWGMVRESLRLFVEAFQALKELGVDEPEKHIIELTNQVSGWGQLIITKQKIDYKMLSLIDEQMSRWPHTVTQYSPKDLKAESASDNPYKAFVSAYLAGSAEKYISNFESDISPTSDDSPFFFKYYKLSSLFRSDLPPKNLYGGEVDLVHGYWPFFVMAIVAGQSVILTLLFIFTPMLIFKREGLKARGIFSVLTFFSCLGLGFMFVEIGLMQSLSLILGHPTYSMAAVLATMLIGAGAGSLIVAHFETKRLELFVFSSIFFIVSLALFICFRGDLNRILLGQNFYFRVMYAVAVSGGLSFSMGFFFPVGLGMARNISSAFVPWSWAVNAGFSVIGSMAAMLIAMNFGFQSVFEIALATYLVSFFPLFRIARLENGIGGK